MEARDYKTRMSLEEKKWYIEKFRMKMAGSLPSTGAWWIDGINMGTEGDMIDIYYEIRNELDWISRDPQREHADMPAWWLLYCKSTATVKTSKK